MNKTILNNKSEYRQANIIRLKIKENTYTNNDLAILLGLIKRNAEKLDVSQRKQLCELGQFLFAVERQERLPEDILDLVDIVLVKGE
ncbi:hypothetical protein [Lentibacillus cibarius]|uniref:Uncharacterized protein n=1 Tax=Lentibacillus cibarius TaxID=2583219 RepID=A0A5S3QJ39_9BACI|nr:hypothetical protein [Lentibacillus cibarius]TMN21848.1 hypothetical protein FFL34_06765 [Lentibacillus cibarius]